MHNKLNKYISMLNPNKFCKITLKDTDIFTIYHWAAVVKHTRYQDKTVYNVNISGTQKIELIAKIKECNVVAIAGSDEKCDWLKNELGVDRTINYKKENILDALKATCPNGIDIYFDNVGGDTLDAALTLMNKFGRIPVCGLISMYNDWSSTGPKMYRNILMKTLTVTGFLVSDFADQFEECLQTLGQWVAEGKIKYKVDVVEGIENAPSAVNKLFTGENQGKLVIQTSREP